MGFVRKHTGLDLTGGGASDAAGDAARRQEGAAREGLAALRGDLAPFREVGTQASNLLLEAILGQSPQMMSANDVINNPFFKALSQQQDNDLLQQRAALGLAGSGGTQDSLNRNMLLLGNQFQQQDYQNQLAANQQRFNQLFNVTGLGSNAAAQTGTASLNTLNNIGQIQGIPGLVEAQVKANQGQQFMQAAPGLMSGLSGLLGSGGLAGLLGAGGAGLGAGSATAGGLGGLTGAAGMAGFSDLRLKENIEKVGEDEHGNIYEFNYIGDSDRYRGRMAQELPEEFTRVHESGYLMVTPEFAAVRI